MEQDFLSTKSDKQIQLITLYTFQDIDIPELHQITPKTVTKLYGVTSCLIGADLKPTYDGDFRLLMEHEKPFQEKLAINYEKEVLCSAVQVNDIKGLLAQTYATEAQIETYVSKSSFIAKIEQRSDDFCEFYEIFKFKERDLFLVTMARRKYMIIAKNDQPIKQDMSVEDVDVYMSMLSKLHGVEDKRKLIYEVTIMLRNSKTLTNVTQKYLQHQDKQLQSQGEVSRELQYDLKQFVMDAMLTIPTYKKDTVSFDWENTSPICK